FLLRAMRGQSPLPESAVSGRMHKLKQLQRTDASTLAALPAMPRWPVMHLYAQTEDPTFLSEQLDFAREHLAFEVHKLKAQSVSHARSARRNGPLHGRLRRRVMIPRLSDAQRSRHPIGCAALTI